MTTLFCYVDVQGTYNFDNITKYFNSSKTRLIQTLSAIPDWFIFKAMGHVPLLEDPIRQYGRETAEQYGYDLHTIPPQGKPGTPLSSTTSSRSPTRQHHHYSQHSTTAPYTVPKRSDASSGRVSYFLWKYLIYVSKNVTLDYIIKNTIYQVVSTNKNIA